MIICYPRHPNHLSQDLDSILRTFLEQFALVTTVIQMFTADGLTKEGFPWVFRVPKKMSSYQASAELCHFLCCHLLYSCCGQISHPLELSSWGKQGPSHYNNLKQLRISWTPVGLRLLVPVMKAKQDWQRLCINHFFLLKHTVCCCHYPSAPNLQKRNMDLVQ